MWKKLPVGSLHPTSERNCCGDEHAGVDVDGQHATHDQAVTPPLVCHCPTEPNVSPNTTLGGPRQILEYIQSYVTQRGLVGKDGSVGLPIVLCGDFNGTRDGQVARFLQSQGFRSAYDDAGAVTLTAHAADWVSHRHRDGSCVGVDFMWVLNPSLQVGVFTHSY